MRRLAILVVRRRWWVLAIALVALPASALYGGSVHDHLSPGGFLDPGAESTRTAATIAKEFPSSGQSDFVVVVCPLKPETVHLIDGRRLALMKSTAFLVNVARGAIVDQAALVEALESERIAGAGLDVFEREPVGLDDDILGARNVIAAPHSLGYTDELLRSCIDGACSSILAVAGGRVPAHVVNREVLTSAAFLRKLNAQRSRLPA